MVKVPVYNLQGEKAKEIQLSARLFGRAVKPAVVHQVVVAQEANSRQVLAHTKDRSEVRGGGKKPWRQKGTGRARHGSSRSPIWIGGGVTFGPTKERNFSKLVNKKQKQAALAMCLSDRLADGRLAIFEKLENTSGKTKDLNGWLKTVQGKVPGLKEAKKFLLVSDNKDEQIIKAVANLKNVMVIAADSLNCVDILKYDTLLVSAKAIEVMEKHYRKIKDKKQK
jgi:large subunit ribosomal protein L4